MFFDSHTHTVNSDGRQTVDEMCAAAMEKGVKGIAVTDHVDMNFYAERDHFNRIQDAIRQTQEAKEKYDGSLEVLTGVELGEYLYDAENAKKVLSLPDYDVVLCSVHLVPKARFDKPYNRIPFSEDGTDAELREYLRLYFELLSETVDCFDFDVLAHITCPVRYMTGLHERETNVMAYELQIRQILQKIINRNIALEVNTGGLNQRFHYCNVQNEDILRLYRSMGGTMVTLGSDAHSTAGICHAFEQEVALLKDLGFTHYYYFKNRRPCAVEL